MKYLARFSMAALFLASGIQHFRKPRPFVKIVPPLLPSPYGIVYVSGALEVIGAIAMLIPPLHSFARHLLIALLIAVFPANVYMAMYRIPLGRKHLPDWLLWGRLPLQFVLIWLVWLGTS
jgi:uncharacterized membrane protein